MPQNQIFSTRFFWMLPVVSLVISNSSNDSIYSNSNYNLDRLLYRQNTHPSIWSIKEKVFGFNSIFSFSRFTPNNIPIVIKKVEVTATRFELATT